MTARAYINAVRKRLVTGNERFDAQDALFDALKDIK